LDERLRPRRRRAGNVYFATGNGPWNGTTDFAMSVMKLPGTLNVANGSYFTPINEETEPTPTKISVRAA
jgi:hypothetical protein